MSKQGRRVTLKDVAQQAGVSVTTAAKVLSNKAREFRIGDQTAQRVRKVARRLGYVPSHAARLLRSKRSGLIALFFSDATDPISAGILHPILKNLHVHDYFPIVTVAETGLQQAYEMWQGNRAEGVIFCGANAHVTHSLFADLRRDRIVPLMAGNCYFHKKSCTFLAEVAAVRVDDRAGIKLAINHLFEQGRSQLAFIPGPGVFYDAIERRKAYEELIREHHAPIVAAIRGRQMYWQRGYVGARQLLQKHGRTIDAVIAYDDPVAMGAIKYVSENGIRVPEDVAVVGFDNQPDARYAIPSLTSVHQPVDEIGRKSVEFMKKMLQEQAKPEHLYVSPQLIARTSTLGGQDA
ncbi:MAG: LacI family DNA-binding transcriptional regulator [Pirellulaceae bacterium]